MTYENFINHADSNYLYNLERSGMDFSLNPPTTIAGAFQTLSTTGDSPWEAVIRRSAEAGLQRALSGMHDSFLTAHVQNNSMIEFDHSIINSEIIPTGSDAVYRFHGTLGVRLAWQYSFLYEFSGELAISDLFDINTINQFISTQYMAFKSNLSYTADTQPQVAQALFASV